jgi:outer membrane protein OmpA-like peptidoglycan-associated protein
VPFDEPQPAGTPIRVSWTQSAGTTMKLTVRAHDPDGFYFGVELYPWRVEIPHEEVNFATNSFTIDKSEEPKLDRSLQQISDAVARYGRWADIKLFIAGHTDTVGDSASNRALSLNRARAISQYFARRGVKVPILFAGFGEDALKVATPDETDEARNRRAEYIVAIEAPEARGGIEWKRLR